MGAELLISNVTYSHRIWMFLRRSVINIPSRVATTILQKERETCNQSSVVCLHSLTVYSWVARSYVHFSADGCDEQQAWQGTDKKP